MKNQPKRLFVACYHSYVDTSSGAATSLRDMMEALVAKGWEVRVLSGPMLDFGEEKSNHQLLTEQGVLCESYQSHRGGETFELCLFSANGVDCGLWIPAQPQTSPSQSVGSAWLSCYRQILDDWKPDVVLTYGGFWMTRPTVALAKRAGARTIFFLCNYAYSDRSLFTDVDVTITASQYHAQWCRDQLGIHCTPVYPLMPPQRYLCEFDVEKQYVTFVNPQPHKGAFLFAKIAEVMREERPDIRFLVVEGRASVQTLANTGADLSQANLFRMANTPDPRDYLKATRVLLVPSACQESFGRVAAEAMMNGIPVLASDRGALPEVVGGPRHVLALPNWMTPESKRLPSRDEIAAWIGAIERLWEDEAYHAAVSIEMRQQSRQWDFAGTVRSFERAILGQS